MDDLRFKRVELGLKMLEIETQLQDSRLNDSFRRRMMKSLKEMEVEYNALKVPSMSKEEKSELQSINDRFRQFECAFVGLSARVSVLERKK